MNDGVFPSLMQRQLTDEITWRFYKHWGQGYLAGEGIEEVHGDHSGCVHWINGMRWVSPPCVAQARLYESSKGDISAVYSYPNGIGAEDRYFWEIWAPGQHDLMPGGPERFDTEAEMEQRVIELLTTNNVA